MNSNGEAHIVSACDQMSAPVDIPADLQEPPLIGDDIPLLPQDTCETLPSISQTSQVEAMTSQENKSKSKSYDSTADSMVESKTSSKSIRRIAKVGGKVRYACTFCNRIFRQRSDAVVHERVHTGERPYECKFCNKSFTQKGAVVVHERIHTGDKPFKCSYCEKSFSDKSNKVRHERVHTGETPYKCSICNKGFKHNSQLKTHLKSHFKPVNETENNTTLTNSAAITYPINPLLFVNNSGMQIGQLGMVAPINTSENDEQFKISAQSRSKGRASATDKNGLRSKSNGTVSSQFAGWHMFPFQQYQYPQILNQFAFPTPSSSSSSSTSRSATKQSESKNVSDKERVDYISESNVVIPI